MQFTRLKLKNWRNFTRVDLALGERLFITGPNASGKSNLMDAFRFLRDIAKSGGGLQEAVTLRGGLPNYAASPHAAIRMWRSRSS